MKILRSKIFQISILLGFVVLPGIFLIVGVEFLGRFSVINWLESCFNFMSKIDPSGILVFAGIAAGLVYLTNSYFFYKSGVFVFGLAFAIFQSSIAAIGTVDDLSVGRAVMIYFTLICGVGFLLFAIMAMTAYEYDRKNKKETSSKGNDEKNSNQYLHITLNLSAKNDSAQPSPAPSDLAHDLRYSRSRARRSRVRR